VVLNSAANICEACSSFPEEDRRMQLQDQDFRFSLTLNGKTCEVGVPPSTTLLDLIRDHLGLTGTKKGCDMGACGACTVLADGRRIKACLALAASYEGASITTIEGIASATELHPLQAAFIKHDALQCGYCTPGQIMSAIAVLAEQPKDRETIRDAMSGNLCRCGAYPNIVEAIAEVAGL
jgi:xanthine dehydrogenase YagT iron-sulfur-binding subunit